MYRVAAQWNRRIDPVQLVEKGQEYRLRTRKYPYRHLDSLRSLERLAKRVTHHKMTSGRHFTAGLSNWQVLPGLWRLLINAIATPFLPDSQLTK